MYGITHILHHTEVESLLNLVSHEAVPFLPDESPTGHLSLSEMISPWPRTKPRIFSGGGGLIKRLAR
jgi:hypothetical protein